MTKPSSISGYLLFSSSETAIRFRYATIILFMSFFYLATQLLSSNVVPFRFMPQFDGDLDQVTLDLR
ncbi:MAG: hypothetical protein AAGJ29_13890, partial [Pseudomonadota bacterium]